MPKNKNNAKKSALATNLDMEMPEIEKKSPNDHVIALAGEPNTGKSTVFNALTGLRQHTGNWPGKTVSIAQGNYEYKDENYVLVDLPGTYSLLSRSQEEEIADAFIIHGGAECTVVVTDSTCLERHLVLLLQVMELTDNVVLCCNIMDEAKRKGISIDLERLQNMLGIPVVGCSAGPKEGLDRLMDAVEGVCNGTIKTDPLRLICDGTETGDERIEKLRGKTKEESDESARRLVERAQELAHLCVFKEGESSYEKTQKKVDRIVMGKGGIPVMLLLLFVIFWFTLRGADYPSDLLQQFFDWSHEQLWILADQTPLPWYIKGIFLDGMFAVAGTVISVMLPPMAIFFPCFTLLEDFGYLPRVAFRLDNAMRGCGACGKQTLTMCMGFGCNAAGVVGARIIDSPRERLLAILTNNLVPCNGRFPTLLLLITCFFSGTGFIGSVESALILTGVVFVGVLATLALSKILNETVLKGEQSSFVLELPPYRKPQIKEVIVRSVIDRTAKVLGRAVMVAAPAGLLIWLLANVTYGGTPLITIISNFLNPLGMLLGMDGVILTAFILGIPANEIVMPIAVMILTSTGALGNGDLIGPMLIAAGWTWKTGLCTMLFCLFHWPCATTLLSIHKETESWKWTGIAFLAPTCMALVGCMALNFVLMLF